MSNVQSGAVLGSLLPGDTDPSEFDMTTYLTRDMLRVLLISSAPIQKQCIWLRSQALSVGWEFKNGDEKFPATKHKAPFTFDSFTEWVHWCKEYENIMLAMIWSAVYGKAILVHFLPDEAATLYENRDYYGPIVPNQTLCTASQTFHPLFNGQGYRIKSVDTNGDPEIYELNFTNKDPDYVELKTELYTYYVHASRVVVFNELSLDAGYLGISKLQTTGHLAIIQRQMLGSVFVQMKNLAAGVLACRCANAAEKVLIEEKLDVQFSHLTKLFYMGNIELEDVVKVIVPDLKIDQLTAINLMLQKQFAEAANLSIRTLGEEDIAAGIGEGGAGISHELVIAEIRDIQRHFQRPIEECFYLLGKKDTSFIWNQPLIQDEELALDQDDKGESNKSLDGDKPADAQSAKDVKSND
jgi:hypothetical protein